MKMIPTDKESIIYSLRSMIDHIERDAADIQLFAFSHGPDGKKWNIKMKEVKQ